MTCSSLSILSRGLVPALRQRARMSLDAEQVKKLRQETPRCLELVHLNNAGTALSPTPVVKAVQDYLALEQELGGYEAELARREELEGVYHTVARLVGGNPAEIALTQNATRAWDMIFYALDFQPGDRVLTCRSEYASNYIAFLQRQRQTGLEIVVLEDDSEGAVCLESLRRELTPCTKLVAINHMPTNGGLVQPAQEIGKIVKPHPALFLLDACQTAGQLPLDVKLLGCDALSATSRKYLRGPRGLGFLWCSQQLTRSLEPPMLDLHAATWFQPDRYRLREDARRFECYEGFVAGRLGLGAAAEYALEVGLENSWPRLQQLADSARQGLSRISGVEVHDLGRTRGGIVTFTVADLAPETVREELSRRRINVWTCSANSARLDMEARKLDRVVRASFHYYNTEQEVERLLFEIGELS